MNCPSRVPATRLPGIPTVDVGVISLRCMRNVYYIRHMLGMFSSNTGRYVPLIYASVNVPLVLEKISFLSVVKDRNRNIFLSLIFQRNILKFGLVSKQVYRLVQYDVTSMEYQKRRNKLNGRVLTRNFYDHGITNKFQLFVM